jgi:2-polyprenyl-3-methyl-5-hydroxy-6-metoxy-1,4-benzoquinol methylase
VNGARAKVFLTVRGRYDCTAATVAGILENAGEPVDLCIFDDRSDGDEGDRLWNLYSELRREGRLALLIVNTERTTGGYVWGKTIMLAQFSRLLGMESFLRGADLVAILDNDVRLEPGWLSKTRRALELAERKWPGRVAVVSPIYETNHRVIEKAALSKDVHVELKRNIGSAAWVIRPEFFERYGLPPIETEGHAGNDLYYGEAIGAKGHLFINLAEPLAFHVGSSNPVIPHSWRHFAKGDFHMQTRSKDMPTRETCPLCDAPADAAEHLVTSRAGYELFKCPECDVVYSKEHLDDDRFFAIYDEEYARDNKYFNEDWQNLYGRLAGLFFESRPRGRVLEIGCGTGVFLKRLQDLGYTVRGIEPAKYLAAEAAKLDLDVKVLSLDEMRVPPPVARFDCVITMHVLEHFVDPVAAVEKIAKLLKPEGVWFNYMPNVSVAMQDDGAHGPNWIHFNPPCLEHLTFFDEKTIRVLAEKAGLEVIETGASCDDFWTWARKPQPREKDDG